MVVIAKAGMHRIEGRNTAVPPCQLGGDHPLGQKRQPRATITDQRAASDPGAP